MILECECCENWTRIPDYTSRLKLAHHMKEIGWCANYSVWFYDDCCDTLKMDYIHQIFCNKCTAELIRIRD